MKNKKNGLCVEFPKAEILSQNSSTFHRHLRQTFCHENLSILGLRGNEKQTGIREHQAFQIKEFYIPYTRHYIPLLIINRSFFEELPLFST